MPRSQTNTSTGSGSFSPRSRPAERIGTADACAWVEPWHRRDEETDTCQLGRVETWRAYGRERVSGCPEQATKEAVHSLLGPLLREPQMLVAEVGATAVRIRNANGLFTPPRRPCPLQPPPPPAPPRPGRWRVALRAAPARWRGLQPGGMRGRMV